VFDRIITGRTLRSPIIVDNVAHESIAIVPEHSFGCNQLTRILDETCSRRGKPLVTRSDNGPEFTSKAMLYWSDRQGEPLKQIEPGKPNQDTYVESFIGRMRDECLNKQWLVSLAHSWTVIGKCLADYNEHRSKKTLGGLTPDSYAKQM
jgi:putative transposase